MSHALGDSISDALSVIHAFTGCDTFQQMKSNKTIQEYFSELEYAWDVSYELFQKLQVITCNMYLLSASTTEENKLRYKFFCARRGEIELSQLHPCEDCLFMHALRANNQSAIWRRCLQAQPFVSSYIDCGWTKRVISPLLGCAALALDAAL
uniref:Uncharacterized protein n=1 Tax=Octopus bimaculoides TaxID=37653 RepID=A0A0L8HPJ3_OCTBM